MTLPPATMDNGPRALVDFYIDFGRASETPIILQQAPHIPMYRHTELPAQALAEIADRAPAVKYFKIEGPGSAAKMKALAPLLDGEALMFGGGGGISALDELRSGAGGLIPGVGFNEIFLAAWDKWTQGDARRGGRHHCPGRALDQSRLRARPRSLAAHAQAADEALWRHRLRLRVRRPTPPLDACDLPAFFAIVDALDLRVSLT